MTLTGAQVGLDTLECSAMSEGTIKMIRSTTFVIAALLVMSTIFIVTGCKGKAPDAEQTPSDIATPTVPDAPEATAANASSDDAAPELVLTDIDGKTISLAASRGKIVVIYFWATYCKPCVEKLPKMQAIYEAYNSKGVEIWALAQDPDQATVDAWLETRDIAFPIAMADQSVNEKFFPGEKLFAIPQAVVIGADGKIAARLGTDLTLEDVETTIKQLLSEKK